MPLIIEGERVPTHWAKGLSCRAAVSTGIHRGEGLRLAFVNNMPDAALEDTEAQFFELLDAASGAVPVYLSIYSLPGIPRGERGKQHLANFYSDFNDLWQSKCDGLIITGTEPHQANLQDEPYWPLLTEIFDWAGRETTATILSCLAAHASVLHADGIRRRRLPDKQFGVFESRTTCKHRLASHLSDVVKFPHSRWNEVAEEELSAAGYTILTKSQEAGVDMFLKKKRRSLFLHFQGHPEYSSETLFKEYRRDIKRFLRGERESYPSMPYGYFDPAATDILVAFRAAALSSRAEEAMISFPESLVTDSQSSWQPSAVCVYRNWLQYVLAEKAQPTFVSIPSFEHVNQRRQPAM